MTAPRDLAAEARSKADAMRTIGRPATALLLTELADRIAELEAASITKRLTTVELSKIGELALARLYAERDRDEARARVTELEAAQREPIGYAAEQHRLRMLAFVEDMTHRADVPHPLREHAINLLREVTE